VTRWASHCLFFFELGFYRKLPKVSFIDICQYHRQTTTCCSAVALLPFIQPKQSKPPTLNIPRHIMHHEDVCNLFYTFDPRRINIRHLRPTNARNGQHHGNSGSSFDWP
jgi:hypothetical protein